MSVFAQWFHSRKVFTHFPSWTNRQVQQLSDTEGAVQHQH